MLQPATKPFSMTPLQKYLTRNFFYQLLRFVITNLKILKAERLAHKG